MIDVAQQALDMAREAKAEIDAHEDICAIRYEGIETNLKTLNGRVTWLTGSAFSIIIAILGFLAAAQFNANDQARRDQTLRADAQQAKIDLLQQQLVEARATRSPQ